MPLTSGAGESPLSEVRRRKRNIYAQAARLRKWATYLETGEKHQVTRVARLLRKHADILVSKK